MGELLKTTYPDMTNRCRVCGKLEGEDGDDFIHTFDEMMDLSEEEKMACEWFAEKMGDKPFPDMTQMAHHYTKEEMIHIFVLEHLIDKLMAKKPICETCFSNKRGEKVLS